ncbi:peptide/nickel transport system substrate-binding protein [Clostridium tetanomorphum]|uniref:ABC transporter substrate-binding protein n=1 Tax=Clostridium tetanomorphum TaxID=1553 RepID=UPI00156E5932|nr:ABC transporter substrate-binding protein [Clostridium tetanomorphum]MBP1865099.1 peptide/nickel transport system substrate-binding protein [Clostridium tetanomorphum]NRS84762.1 peptide/nickel transport system substrate-binding protein [Clostridium tetanomorphum]
MLKLKKTLIIALSVSIVALGLIGCQKRKNEKATSNNLLNQESVESNKERTDLVIAVDTGMVENGFDPTTGWGRYGSPLFQSTLVKRGEDNKIVNDLATNYKVSNDGLTWTFNIRKDVKFTDEQPLTAKDIVYTYNTTAKSGSVVDLNIIDSVTQQGDYTINFKLKHPQSTFINIVEKLGIVPKHAHNDKYRDNPIGSGPFKLVQLDKEQQFIVGANTNYYGDKPFFKKLTFLYLNEDAGLAAAKSGKVDILYVTPTLGKEKIKGMHLLEVQSVDNRGIIFPYVKSGHKGNKGNPVGNDVTSDSAIRKAINFAVDRKSLVNGILNGFGTECYSICDGLPWYNPDSKIKDADIEKAKKILVDGGWKDTNSDGILEKNGLKAEFTLLYPSNDALRQSLALAVADQMKPIGIKINVKGKGWDEIPKRMYSDAVMLGWGNLSPLELYNVYSSKTMGLEFFNSGYYSNPKVDEYLNKALLALSEEEANNYFKKAQWDGITGFSAQGDAPWTWLVNINHLYFVRDDLDIGEQRIQPHGTGWPITDNIAKWKWKN